jgi:hypothetical protein
MNGNAMLVSTVGGLNIQQQDYAERKEEEKIGNNGDVVRRIRVLFILDHF